MQAFRATTPSSKAWVGSSRCSRSGFSRHCLPACFFSSPGRTANAGVISGTPSGPGRCRPAPGPASLPARSASMPHDHPAGGSLCADFPGAALRHHSFHPHPQGEGRPLAMAGGGCRLCRRHAGRAAGLPRTASRSPRRVRRCLPRRRQRHPDAFARGWGNAHDDAGRADRPTGSRRRITRRSSGR